jgi:hypothetical protein
MLLVNTDDRHEIRVTLVQLIAPVDITVDYYPCSTATIAMN